MKKRPPKLFHNFFRWYCRADLLSFIEGDLLEVYSKRLSQYGMWKADLLFIKDVMFLFRSGIVRPIHIQNINRADMIANYFKVGFRNLLRSKLHTSINSLGLALGICTSLIIYIIVSYEFSFDKFHPGQDRMYRILSEITETTGDKITFARTPAAIQRVDRMEISGVEAIAGIIPYNTTGTIAQSNSDLKNFESRIPGTHFITTGIVEPDFFNVFPREWIFGDEQTLSTPNAIVLTESRARQYFGDVSIENLLGKEVIIDDSLRLTLTGVVKDWKGNTDFGFTDFISFNTIEHSFLKNRVNVSSWNIRGLSAWNFIKLKPQVSSSQVEAQLKTIVARDGDPGTKLNLQLEPLAKVHFNDNIIENPLRIANLQTLYILIGIAAFILVMAVINFITLATAQSIQRIKEVSIRKTLGGRKWSITLQFLVETFLITMLATLISLAMFQPILNSFENFLPNGLSYNLLDGKTLVVIFAGMVITTFLAGLYPALKLSSYQPVLGMKGFTHVEGHSQWTFRKSLTVFQFSISVIFIIGSLVIASQLWYIQQKDLGFEPDSIVTINVPWGTSHDKINAFTSQVKQVPDVMDVATQWLSPMSDNPRGMKLKIKETDEQDFWVTQIDGDENYIPLYKIKLLAGRNLEPTDTVKEFVINETLMKYIGIDQPVDALGKILYWNDMPYPVVGVVVDFHTHSLHQVLTPLCIINRQDRQGAVAIKFNDQSDDQNQKQELLRSIEKSWKSLFPDDPFNYNFFEDSLAILYQRDRQTSTLINVSMGIAIFISCLGLFGLTHLITQRRSKEMSIRKVLGAGVQNLVTLISKDFIIQVVLAISIASPVAAYLMNQWLNNFAYHTDIKLWIYVVAGSSIMLITFCTVGLLTIKAALTNPVQNLKSE